MEQSLQVTEYPVWFNGKTVNEALFCEEFLREHKMLFTNGAFFTPDGRVTNPLPLRREIYDKLRTCVETGFAKRIGNIVEVLKLEAQVEDFPPEPDRIHVANGTLLLDGTFTEGKPEIVRSRLPVAYQPDTPSPDLWLNFLNGLLYEEDIPTLQEFIGYSLIPSNKGQRMMVIKGNGGEGKSQIGAVLGRIFGSNMKDGSIGKISENRFARADLEHILLCVDDDMQMEALRQTNYVKSIVTAQGKMDLERKGKQSHTRYEWKEGDKKHVEMRINPEQAKTVRTIFDMYLAGEGLIAIKYELEKLGYKTSTGKSNWHGTVISHILKNTFYCGIMTYHKEYTPDYLKQKKVKNYGEMKYTRVQGTHEPIVTVEEFDRVQKIMASRQMSYPTENNTAAKKGKKNRTTVWGKLLVCSCGHNFNMRFWNKKDRQVQHSFQCYGSLRTGSYQTRLNKGLSVEGICRTPMIPEWRLQMMANLIFRNYLNNKAKVLALANSMLEAHIDDPEEEDNTQELMEAKQQELAHLEKKLDGYIEMRSEGEMNKEMFTRKSSEVDAKIKQLQDELAKLEHRAKPKPVTNYREKLTVLQYALEQYTHVDEGKDVPESVIEAFVERIVASPDGFEWFLRFEGEPDKPLFCQIEGKRKKSAKVMIAGEIPPSEDCSGSGCDQGLISSHKRKGISRRLLRKQGSPFSLTNHVVWCMMPKKRKGR